MTTTQESIHVFQCRYKEGYTIARLTAFIGMLVQFGAAILAVAFIVGSLFGASQIAQLNGTPPQVIALIAAVGIVFGIVFGALFYLLGVLISAQGQIILATLDTAVNSTPSLSDDEKHLIVTCRAKPVS